MFVSTPTRIGVAALGVWVTTATSAWAIEARAQPMPQPQAATCPYHFRSDMPEATFCVYRGAALGRDGEVCANDVVAIWSSFTPASLGGEDDAKAVRQAQPEVYLAFVADPEIVLRALADSLQGDHAVMVGYTLDGDSPQPLEGTLTLQTGVPNVLRLDLARSGRSGAAGCAFVSYAGTYLGLMQPLGVVAAAAVEEVR